ncbi:MAG: hypothetical protein Q8P18_21865 [Pseudomonadota bacterium]|nr:hypothetical protein [Pseudomonadota bacterium]
MPPAPNLNPILLKLREQLRNPEGAARLTRREIVYLAVWAMQREDLSPWTKHARECEEWGQKPLARRCTCGFTENEERARRRRAEMLRLIGEPDG